LISGEIHDFLAQIMARFTSLHLVPALLAAAAHAGELTIEARPFSIRHTFPATALPGSESVLLEIPARVWADYKISEIAPHGSRVSKNDTLVTFDPTDIDKKLHDLRQKLTTDTLALQQAEQDYEQLVNTVSHKLEAIRRAAETAKEDNAYFTTIQRKAKEESAEQSLKRSEQLLENQREELRQLTKMYEADDLTEETEEIILERQKNSVAAAEFALRMEVLNNRRTLDTLLPREAEALANAERDTALLLKKGEQDLPRSVEIKSLELEALKTALAREKKSLADLEADRAFFEFKAPADGWFYYGPIRDGRWAPAEIAKVLIPHGIVPTKRAFATFIPAAANLGWVAFVDGRIARSLGPESSGAASLSGREDLEIPSKVVSLAATPEADGTFRADLSASWPEGFVPPPGSTGEVTVISYEQAAALAVPSKALEFGSQGWTVEVKLADGKTERRPVKRGRVSGEETEILSGLEPGQVIIVP
jgi:HlyD family secretion protein